MCSLNEISHTNPEKPLTLLIDGREYYRCPIHTRLIKVGDNLSQLVEEYVSPYFEEGDCVYISEKIVSLCQRDIIPKEDVKLSWTAKFLSKFASTNDSAGVGVHNVYKMQVAILLCGKPKVIFAAIAAGVARIFGKRGVFYEITGPQVAGLDGFYSTYFEDYKNFGILSPKEPDKAAARVEAVSYTHLDVYKRQDICRGWKKSCCTHATALLYLENLSLIHIWQNRWPGSEAYHQRAHCRGPVLRRG